MDQTKKCLITTEQNVVYIHSGFTTTIQESWTHPVTDNGPTNGVWWDGKNLYTITQGIAASNTTGYAYKHSGFSSVTTERIDLLGTHSESIIVLPNGMVFTSDADTEKIYVHDGFHRLNPRGAV